MAVGAEPRSWNTWQRDQGSRLRLGVPGPDNVDDRRVPHEHGMQPFAQQALGELRIAATGAHEIGERPEHAVPELFADLEQRLRRGGEADMLALELTQRITTRFQLRQSGLRLPPSGARAHLLFMQCGDMPACML